MHFNYSIISIHAPHEGERHTQTRVIKAQERFQSTLPTRGSDASIFSTFDLGLYFNPRSPRGGATSSADTTSSSARFNPRSPRGGATLINDLSEQICEVSIHAPHEGERPLNPDVRNYHRCFNPRSPRGGATQSAHHLLLLHRISIHAPHEGGRPSQPIIYYYSTGFQSTLPTRGSDYIMILAALALGVNFNPRSPRGGATGDTAAQNGVVSFQSTLPTRGSDNARAELLQHIIISIHAPHEGERREVGFFLS